MKEEKDKSVNEEMEENETHGSPEPETESESKNEINSPENIKEEDTESSFEDRIQELEEKNKELNERILRRVAEFENYKKRTELEQDNLLKYGAEMFILKILPIYDDLMRSLNHIEEENLESLREGLKMVADKFGKTLEEQGVKKIEAKGKSFDFNFHEALMQQAVEGVPPHTVLEEVEPGYMYKDKVIKHVKVIVSQESSDTSPEG